MSSTNAPTPPQPEPSGFVVEETTLWVEFEIEMDCVEDCPISTAGAEYEGSVQLAGTTCHVTVVPDDETDEGAVVTRSSTVGSDCLCPALYAPGFAPVELQVVDGALYVSAYVEDRESLTTVLDRIRPMVDTWHLRRLTTPNRHGYGGVGIRTSALAELSLTEKQEQAVSAAVEMGYYETPREASLGDIAERLGVSLSALSQRLTAVETKLVHCVATEL
jgi:hypothetical protein